MATAGLQTTEPLALGLLLGAPAPAGILTTEPLIFGLLQNTFRLAAGAGSVPITGQNATLSVPSTAADVGTSFPTVLGLLLGTSGSSAFTLTAAAGSVPINGQGAQLIAASPADVQVTEPLALGFLLTQTNFVLTAAPGAVVLDFLPSDSTTFTLPDQPTLLRGGGGGEPDKKKRKPAWEDLRSKPREFVDERAALRETIKRAIEPEDESRPFPVEALVVNVPWDDEEDIEFLLSSL